MDVASQNDINTSTINEFFHGRLHVVGLRLALMSRIGVVPRRVDDHHHPRSPPSVHLPQVILQPLTLHRITAKIGVGTEHDDVDATPRGVEGVVEVGVGAALLKGHPPPRVVGGEGVAVDKGDLLHLVVALRHHPRPLPGQRLHQPPKIVPHWLVEIGVG